MTLSKRKRNKQVARARRLARARERSILGRHEQWSVAGRNARFFCDVAVFTGLLLSDVAWVVSGRPRV